MKKTFVAVAVLGAFAGSAMAADVTLYGRIDTGLAYTHTDVNDVTTNKAEMTSGWSTGARWGIKGAEDLGNGFKVGFVLENGFDSDTGKMGQDGRIFGRESTLYVASDFGTLYAGRMNTLLSDGGSMGVLGATSAIGNAYGFGTMKGSTGAGFARHDNMLGYVSPTFAGFKLSAQYSMKSDDVKTKIDPVTGKEVKVDAGTENKANANRYAALAATYSIGGLNLVLGGDYNIYGHAAGVDVDNGWNVIFGGNYDFEVVKVFAKAAYFKDMKDIADTLGYFGAAETGYTYQGYGLEFGAKAPVLGGNLFGAVSFRDAKAKTDVAGGEDVKAKRYSAILGYSYAFSKRTNVYTAVNYVQEKMDDEDKASGAQFGLGLVHKF